MCNCPVFVKKCLYNVFILEQLSGAVFVGKTTPQTIGLAADVDVVDRQILSLMQEDCRLSFSKVALKTGISVGTAYNRIRSMEAEGIIKGYTVLVDSSKLGYNLTTIILVQVEGGHLDDVEEGIAEASNVVAVYDVTGDFDAVVIAKFKDRTSLNDFIKKLSATAHVKRAVTNVALNIVKEDFRIKLFSDSE